MQKAALMVPKFYRSTRKTTTPAKLSKTAATLRKFFARSLVFTVGFSTLSLRAGEPILTLAMVNYSSLSHHPHAMVPDQFSISGPRPVSVPDRDPLLEPIKISITEDTFSPTALWVESQRDSAPASPLVLTRKNLRDDSRWTSSRFQAGFGQIFYDKTAAVYGRNGTGWQEPGVGYLKIRFHF